MQLVEIKNVINESLLSFSNKLQKSGFINRPLKIIIIDLCVYFVINTVLIYASLFFIPDPTISMLAVIWVSIIAWRGGIIAGLAATIVLFFSNGVSNTFPPHDQIEDIYFFAGKIPAFLLGLMQCLLSGSIVGYISTLVHKLRKEIVLREEVENALKQRVAELNVFGRTVAHDLKNPLMVINASIITLLKEFANSDNKKAKKRLDYINDSTKHMVNIIESILVLAGVKNIDPKQYKLFNMSQCIESALDRMDHSIESNDVRVTKIDSWPSVVGYAPWITEVWVNYINNAIKYGKSPTKQNLHIIELGFDPPGGYEPLQKDQFRFWVKDNGEGIENDKIDELFKEFARLHSTEYEGHGLGLEIVKRVVDKCGGTAGVQSKVGVGSLFFFTLPAPVVPDLQSK